MAKPLASWNDTPASAAIVDFVERTTTRGLATTISNPATAWPCSTTTAPSGPSSRCTTSFSSPFDRVRALAPDHPEWNDDPALKAVSKTT